MDRKKFKFSNQNAGFIIELRKRVKEHFEGKGISSYGNAGLVFKTVVMIVLYFGPLALMLSGVIHLLPLMFLGWFLMGLGMAGIGMGLMHDANHNSYAKSSRVNKWLGGSLFILGGFPQNWKFQHNALHHGFTNIEGQDEDINGMALLRFSPHKPLRRIHRYQHWYAWFFYSLMTISWIAAKDFTGVIRYKKMDAPQYKKKGAGRLLTEVTLTKILYYGIFMVLPLLIMPFAWYWVLAGFLLMHLVSGFTLSIIFQAAHVMPTSAYPVPDEEGNMENNWAVHQLLTTTDFSPRSRIFSWMIGGLNYQVEHHLFPNISHVHYRELSTIVKETAAEYNLPYSVQPNFFVALGSHARMLKRLGRTA